MEEQRGEGRKEQRKGEKEGGENGGTMGANVESISLLQSRTGVMSGLKSVARSFSGAEINEL